MPYTFREKATLCVPVTYEQIPPGELAVRRDARVKAVDGYVGRVDEFLIDPTTRRITHLVLREGHLWSQKDVIIPISKVDRAGENVIHLKLDKHAIKTLPAISVRRWYRPGTDIRRELADMVDDMVVYARFSPDHKVRIVDAHEQRGHTSTSCQ